MHHLVPGGGKVHVVLRPAGPVAAPSPADRAERLDDGRGHHPAPQPGAVEVGQTRAFARPPAADIRILDRLDARPPTAVVILKPDHVRDVDVFVQRYGTRAFGPSLFWRDDIPDAELEPIEPGSELPGGLVALYDGRGRNETPLWLPEQRTLVFADALTAPDGELRVWATPWPEERALPALRTLLELPFEHVIVSHGDPVHDRAASERALELLP